MKRLVTAAIAAFFVLIVSGDLVCDLMGMSA